MVKFSERSPFVQVDQNCNPDAVGSQHIRSMELLKAIVQVDTVLAGFLVLALVGQGSRGPIRHDEKVQVILQLVTCSVFLAAIVHTIILMVTTGWRYTLAWYDPLFPAGFSAVGMILLFLTLADAVLIRLRPEEDTHTPGYWCIIIFGLMMPMALAGPTALLQMVIEKIGRQDDTRTSILSGSTASQSSTGGVL